ncbi:MAG: hypothetical protein JO102_06720 [Elusimicrobia bacterium]|nr:hypothetical protein [Elusimicrobiota bacterium]
MLPPGTRDFYAAALSTLVANNVPFLVGGAYAFQHYTGIVRHTKDLDLFCKPSDCERLLAILESNGFKTEVTFRHWLAKVVSQDADFIDVIFSSGNGVCEVDDDWYRHAENALFLDVPVKIVSCEEMVWSKAYILERNRFDGADIAHLLRAHAHRIHWDRLLQRFGQHWRILLAHLVLFGFIYPSEADRVPKSVMDELLARLQRESGLPGVSTQRLCRGTLLSYGQYDKDIADWGYKDARLAPHGSMTEEDIRQWTAAFQQ